MIAFESQVTNTASAPNDTFPLTAAVNISAPAAGDGTEFVASMVSDQWGARQALMDHVGFTPNAVGESSAASQFLAAIKTFMPIGSVMMWHGLTDMSNFGRFLALEGQTVLLADYLELAANTYVGDTNNALPQYYNYIKTSDLGGLVPNVAGPYYKMPDMRGAFVRGRDVAAAVDPDGATRTFPDFQRDEIQEHSHRIVDSSASPTYLSDTTLTGYASGANALQVVALSGVGFDNIETEATIYDAFSNADETRPSNVMVKYYVRY